MQSKSKIAEVPLRGGLVNARGLRHFYDVKERAGLSFGPRIGPGLIFDF